MSKNKDKKDGSANGGAPAEATAGASVEMVDPRQTSLLAEETSPPTSIPPDQQAERTPFDDEAGSEWAVASPGPAKSTDELKTLWSTVRGDIDELERQVVAKRHILRSAEQELCERYKKAADERGAEPVVMIDGRRMKVKARAARHGGGLGFVDAPIRAAIEL